MTSTTSAREAGEKLQRESDERRVRTTREVIRLATAAKKSSVNAASTPRLRNAS